MVVVVSLPTCLSSCPCNSSSFPTFKASTVSQTYYRFSSGLMLRGTMISCALRHVFRLFLQKEEGKVQGQLNNTDSSQYIRDLKDQIAELKHEVSSYNRGILNQGNNKHRLYLLFSETILLAIFPMCFCSDLSILKPTVEVLTTPISFLR